jgi:hypothetical protein
VTPVDQEPAAEVNSESNAGANNTTERVDWVIYFVRLTNLI